MLQNYIEDVTIKVNRKSTVQFSHIVLLLSKTHKKWPTLCEGCVVNVEPSSQTDHGRRQVLEGGGGFSGVHESERGIPFCSFLHRFSYPKIWGIKPP